MDLDKLIDQILEDKQVMFHGTSSKFLPKILKMGFIPDPKVKKWGLETGRLASHPGTYFASDFMTSFSAGSDAARKFGGNPVMFEVQVETRTADWDEDDLYNPIAAYEGATGYYINQYAAKQLMDPTNKGYAAKILEKSIDDWIMRFAELKVNRELSKQEIKRMHDAVKDYIWLTWKWVADEGENPPDKTFPKELRAARERLLSALPSVALQTPAQFHYTMRVKTPITFGGANRILSAVEFTTYLNNDLPIDDRYQMKIWYGEPSTKFMAGVATNLSHDHWRFVK